LSQGVARLPTLYVGSMPDPPTPSEAASRFVINWSNIESKLRRRLTYLRENDLVSDDMSTVRRAERQVKIIEAWLDPPRPRPTDDEKITILRNILANESIPASERVREVGRLSRSSGRGRGRPRTETSQHALDALTLHRLTSATWAEIAFRVKGCPHKGAGKDASCNSCADAMRDAAKRLESDMKIIGFDFDFPRGKFPIDAVNLPRR
jgi:hypothetical protein